MTQSLRIAIVGTGFMARMQTRNLMSEPNVQIAAVCCLDLVMAEGFIHDNQLADARAFVSFTEMLDQVELDAVYLALPPCAHDGQIVMALDRGLHVFTEKPLALTIDDAQAMANAAVRNRQCVTQVDYQFRFKPSVMRLVDAIKDGSAGRPTLFTARFWVNMDGAAWWRDVNQSGGQMLEQLIHLYNLATALFGQPVCVTGQMHNLCHQGRDDYSIEDTSIGTIRFANDAIACITGSNCAVKDHIFGDFRVVFEHITLDYHATGQSWVTADHADWFANGISERIDESADAHRLAAIDFIHAIREGRKSQCPIESACEDIRLIKAIIQSAQHDGQPVKMETCHAYSGEPA